MNLVIYKYGSYDAKEGSNKDNHSATIHHLNNVLRILTNLLATSELTRAPTGTSVLLSDRQNANYSIYMKRYLNLILSIHTSTQTSIDKLQKLKRSNLQNNDLDIPKFKEPIKITER
jgi:hypothetical protein